jgi:hypothetical protein
MTLGSLIKRLEKLPQNVVVAKGFGAPMSWRGVYAEVAFPPNENVMIADMLKHAISAVGATFTGYKGGEYKMYLGTNCHLEKYSEYHEEAADDLVELIGGLEFEMAEGTL